jgi:hypothetical protein
MTGLNWWVFGETPEESNRKVQELVALKLSQ